MEIVNFMLLPGILYVRTVLREEGIAVEKKRKFRQVFEVGGVPTASEAFLELNPLLTGFIEQKGYEEVSYPTYYNYNYYYGSYCTPRRVCLPRPCSPV